MEYLLVVERVQEDMVASGNASGKMVMYTDNRLLVILELMYG